MGKLDGKIALVTGASKDFTSVFIAILVNCEKLAIP